MKKLVYLCGRYPYPVHRGDQRRSFHHIIELSKYYEVHLVSLVDNELQKSHQDVFRQICASIKTFYISERKRQWNVLREIFSDIPLQVAYFYDKETSIKVQQHINQLNPDHIFAQLVRMAPYVSDCKTGWKSLDYMDCFSLNWKEHGLKWSKYIPGFRNMEMKRLRSYELKTYDQFHNHFIISDRDRQGLALAPHQKVHIASNGVDTTYFDVQKSSPDHDIVFSGNMGYVHNDLAAHYLIDQVMNRLPGTIRLLIGGDRPSSWLRMKQSPNITVKGRTEDIRTYYSDGRIFVAPIFSGSGQQNKILEAMAMGVPVVTTSFVNESIGGIHQESLMLADSPAQFVACIETLLGDDTMRRDLSIVGRQFVKDQYNWTNVTLSIIDRLESA